MAVSAQTEECPAELVLQAVEAVRADELGGLRAVEALVDRFPSDAKLHFLRGSLLAGLQRYDEAHVAMSRSVELAPTYAIARFQLGLLELTSGNAAAAEATWAPLRDLPDDDALRLFVEGLGHLIRDEFALAIGALNRGIACNVENPLVSKDMQLLIGKAQEALQGQQSTNEPISSAHLLLKQYTSPTKH